MQTSHFQSTLFQSRYKNYIIAKGTLHIYKDDVEVETHRGYGIYRGAMYLGFRFTRKASNQFIDYLEQSCVLWIKKMNSKVYLFNLLFDELNSLSESQANNYLSHYWNEQINDWNVSLIDDQALYLLQKDVLFISTQKWSLITTFLFTMQMQSIWNQIIIFAMGNFWWMHSRKIIQTFKFQMNVIAFTITISVLIFCNFYLNLSLNSRCDTCWTGTLALAFHRVLCHTRGTLELGLQQFNFLI